MRRSKQEDFCRTKSVKKRKSQDHYLCTGEYRLKGHHSAKWFDLIIATIDYYNQEAFSSSSTSATLNHSHPHGRKEIE